MYETFKVFLILVLIVRMVTINFPESYEILRKGSEFNMDREMQKRYALLKYLIGNDNSLIYVTGWSLTHVLWGIIVGIIVLIKQYHYHELTFGNYLLELIIIHSLWELFQFAIEITPYWTLRGWGDTATDTVLFMTGTLLPFIATNHSY